jgi:hypothetical protein
MGREGKGKCLCALFFLLMEYTGRVFWWDCQRGLRGTSLFFLDRKGNNTKAKAIQGKTKATRHRQGNKATNFKKESGRKRQKVKHGNKARQHR